MCAFDPSPAIGGGALVFVCGVCGRADPTFCWVLAVGLSVPVLLALVALLFQLDGRALSNLDQRLKREMEVIPRFSTFPGKETMMVPFPFLSSLAWGVTHLRGSDMMKFVALVNSSAFLAHVSALFVVPICAGMLWTT